MRPTVAASRCRNPVNQAVKASAVAPTVTYPNASIAEASRAGGRPSTAAATGARTIPPAISCHAVSDSTSMFALHFFVST
jgi:hypothetical protein